MCVCVYVYVCIYIFTYTYMCICTYIYTCIYTYMCVCVYIYVYVYIYIYIYIYISCQFSSVAQSYLTLCNPMDCSMPSFPIHHQLPELTQTRVHRVSDAIQPSHPLSSPFPLSSIFPSFRVFSNESVLHIMRPKYRRFSFSISPSNEYSGFISFRTDWLDLLAVQGTLKSPLQHHSSKA